MTVHASQSALADPAYFKIVVSDLVRDGLPDLARVWTYSLIQ